MIDINPDRLRETLETLAQIGATARGGVTRLALGDEDRAARDLLARWMTDAGLDVRVDDVGNMYGWRSGVLDSADPIFVGSHLDTVMQGGRFDGALGVAAALEVVRTLNERRVATARPLVLVNWTDEEGVRFQPSMLGSGVASGRLTREYAYAQTDVGGLTFGQELERIGYRGDVGARPPRVAGYLELHIEQGPVLEELGAQIGVVQGIQGISWWKWRIQGHAGHAGTTPMDRRRDALVAASRCVLAVNGLPASIGGRLVTTIGALTVSPGGINIIPDRAEFTLDARAPEADTIEVCRSRLAEIAREARDRGLTVSYEEIAYSEPTGFAAAVVDAVEAAARGRGLTSHRMFSGAGHDAKYMADICDTGMIFVPCRHGISHAEDEFITWDAAAQGTQVLFDAATALARRD